MVIDTASVNYVVGKIDGVAAKLTPVISDISQKYIEYVVVKACVYPIVAFAAANILALTAIALYGLHKQKSYDEEDPILVAAIFLGVVGIILVGVSIACLPDMIIALNCPEMYALESLLKK